MCVLYVSLWSSVTPNSSVMLSTCRCSLVLYSVGSGANSVQVVLSGLNTSLLSFAHVCICCRYGFMYVWHCFCCICELEYWRLWFV